MIIYGWKEVWLKSEPVIEHCPNCKATNSLQIHLFQRYAHIFWVPTFPYNKNGATQCSNCGEVTNYRKLSPSLRLSYDNLKSNIKAPIWMFSGIGVIIIIGIVITLIGQQTSKRVSERVLQPKINDILEIKQKDGGYTLIKINEVTKDSIYFYPNKFQTDKSTGLSDLYDKGYDTVIYMIARKALLDMDKKDEVLDVVRH